MKNGQWVEPAVGRVVVALCCPLPTPFEPSPEPGMVQSTTTASGSILSGARRATGASMGLGSVAGWLLGGRRLLGLVVALEVLLNSTVHNLGAVAADPLAVSIKAIKDLRIDPDAHRFFCQPSSHGEHHRIIPRKFNLSHYCNTYSLVIQWCTTSPAATVLERLEAESTRGAMRCTMVDGLLDCRELWQELEVIGERVDRAYPANHRLRKLFRPIVDPEDFTPPTIDQLVKARAAFFGLPVAEQRRILNGWEPWPGRWSPDPNVEYLRDTLADLTTNDDFPARVLLISAVGKAEAAERSARGGLDGPLAVQTFRYCSGTYPVEVTIKEGTSREEAIEAMESAIDLIRREWGNLISEQCRPFRGAV